MIPNTDWKPRLMTRIRNWGVWSDATLKQARLSAKIQLYYSEIPFGIWMHGDENSDVEQGEYLLLYPKLHLQHVGTCRVQKNRGFGPFYHWFFKADHSLYDMGQAPISSKTTRCDYGLIHNWSPCDDTIIPTSHRLDPRFTRVVGAFGLSHICISHICIIYVGNYLPQGLRPLTLLEIFKYCVWDMQLYLVQCLGPLAPHPVINLQILCLR